MIPKVIHRIWLGDKPLPDPERKWLQSWHRHCSGWQIETWDERRIDEELDLVNRAHYLAATCPAEQSDVARYEILYRHGGVYIDTDMECLKSLDALVDGEECIAAFQRPAEVNTAFLASAPGHPLYRDLVAHLPRYSHLPSLVARTGPGLFNRLLAGRPGVRLYPSEFIYPYTWEQKQNYPPSLDYGRIFPLAFAVHHWRGTWL